MIPVGKDYCEFWVSFLAAGHDTAQGHGQSRSWLGPKCRDVERLGVCETVARWWIRSTNGMILIDLFECL